VAELYRACWKVGPVRQASQALPADSDWSAIASHPIRDSKQFLGIPDLSKVNRLGSWIG